MRQNLTLKALILAVLTLLFAVALTFIGGVISERERYRRQVVEDVARSTARDQVVAGPMLLVPWRERIEVTGERGARTVQETRGESILLPDSLECRTTLQVETRSRGIYRAPVYRAHIHLRGSFTVPAGFGLTAGRLPDPGSPALVTLSVTDLRGLRRPPRLTWDGGELRLVPGTGRSWLGEGVAAPVGDAPAARTVPFTIELELRGTDRFGLVPVGAATRMQMESDWPHPAFSGGFLPDTRTVGARGFTAAWEVSEYATGIRDAIERVRQGVATAPVERLNPRARAQGGPIPAAYDVTDIEDLGVRFIQPVDVYRLSERATKYGLLFVLLTFVAFFLVEVLKRLAVHPIQYTLAGAAVALFFLLLLSLAEYMAFAIAYLVASVACVALLAFYVGHVLHNAPRGAGFAVLLAALYGVLYLLLQSEDYALLLGTLMLFAVLATVMVITRRVDWYRLGEPAAPPGPTP